MFLRRLRLGAQVVGELPITVHVDYQVCDESMCLPPVSEKTNARIKVEATAVDGAR